MNTQPDSYTFNPGEDDKRKQVEQDYTIQGWTFKEVPAQDGSGKITVIFTPPD